MKINEIIVVEGRDDTTRVKEAVSCDTFETNGSAITKEKIERLKILNKNRGIIVLTDPDYSGKRIRNIITQNIPTAKHAYISNKKAVDKRGKIGIEAASKEDIITALKKVYTPLKVQNDEISNEFLLQLGLIGSSSSRLLREKLCDKLNIEYTNAKQLINKLNMYGITKDNLLEALRKIEAKVE